jgi:hydroxymethylpyrimidine/phosphomethylpyrimidine kinase
MKKNTAPNEMSALSIAGYDPSGGAGILNDIKTFHALNVYGAAVITALTAQNVKKVVDILPVDVGFIEKEINTILEEEKIIYAKTGMLYSPDIIKAVSRNVSEYDLQLVVDPVMVAGSGGLLSREDVAQSLKKYLLPLAQLTTPNIIEAQALSGIDIKCQEDAIEAACKIGKICDVVVTGGHLNGNDVLFDGSTTVLEGELLEIDNIHGSGCTYSSACTVYLLKGYQMEEAVSKAGEFTKNAIRYGSRGTVNQFWR